MLREGILTRKADLLPEAFVFSHGKMWESLGVN